MCCESRREGWSSIEVVIHNEQDEELPIVLEIGDELIEHALPARQTISRLIERSGRICLRVCREGPPGPLVFDLIAPRDHGRDAIHIDAGRLRGPVLVIVWTGRGWIKGVPR